MSNMSYCRFHNTFQDFLDCFEHFEEVYSEDELDFRERLYDLALRMVEEYEDFDFSQLAKEDDADDFDEDREYAKL